MTALKSIRNAKLGNVGIVKRAPLPVVNNATYDGFITNLSWRLAKDLIRITARDIVRKLPLLPKFGRVPYKRRWRVLVDLLRSRQTTPDKCANALLTLQHDINAQLEDAKCELPCTRGPVAGVIFVWKNMFRNGHPSDALAAAAIADGKPLTYRVRVAVGPAKEVTKNQQRHLVVPVKIAITLSAAVESKA